LLGAALLGCSDELPPAGQVVLHVTTDAPLPPPPGIVADTPPALFDRLRIELFPRAASEPCSGCVREFSIDRLLVDEGRASVGILPEPDTSGVRARVRLFRSGGTASGEPRPESTLEATLALPAIESEGIVRVHVVLRSDEVGAPRGSLEAPVAAASGAPPLGLSGTWPLAASRPCSGEAPVGEHCIEGGAFWMGDPRLDLGFTPEYDGERERLVVLSPYFLDEHEVTVAEFRASGLARYLVAGQSDNPREAGGSIAQCTYTTNPGPNDALPVNCISWDLAKAYCESLGKILPSEAQLEYAASARSSRRYVWGSDLPGCGDAVYARVDAQDRCGALGVGAALPGAGVRDRLVLASGAVVDLVGNVAEWAADRWNRDDEACWLGGVHVDPLCDAESAVDGPGRVYRGGSYADRESTLPVAIRSFVENEMYAVSAYIGLRCARQ
jgi:formylglycine-generating enzyme required for sulfatase activity